MPAYNHQERNDLALTLADACLGYRHCPGNQDNQKWEAYQAAVKAYEEHTRHANSVQVQTNATPAPQEPTTPTPEIQPVVVEPVVAPSPATPPIQQDQGLNTQRERPLRLPPGSGGRRTQVSSPGNERDATTAALAPPSWQCPACRFWQSSQNTGCIVCDYRKPTTRPEQALLVWLDPIKANDLPPAAMGIGQIRCDVDSPNIQTWAFINRCGYWERIEFGNPTTRIDGLGAGTAKVTDLPTHVCGYNGFRDVEGATCPRCEYDRTTRTLAAETSIADQIRDLPIPITKLRLPAYCHEDVRNALSALREAAAQLAERKG
jgi:hypothetical protein